MTDPIARIEAALGHLGEEHEPPVGWEARVLAAAAATRPEPTQRKWWWFAAPALASAAIASVVWMWPAKELPLKLAFKVQKSGTVVRGDDASLGDVVHATATGGGSHRAVWIYRNDELVVACPGGAQCRSSGGETAVDLTVSELGEYKIVALSSKSSVPMPTGRFDADVANAQIAGPVETQRFKVR